MSILFYLNGIEIFVGLSAIFKPERTLERHHNVTEAVVFAQRRWGLSLIGFAIASIAVASSPDSAEGKQFIGFGWWLYHIGIVCLYRVTGRPLTQKGRIAVAFHAIMSLGFGHYFWTVYL